MSINELSKKMCKPCSGGLDPLPPERVGEYLTQVPGWELHEAHHGLRPPFGACPLPMGEGIPRIARTWKFKDFKEALAFVNRVGNLAEQEGHHPDIAIHWNCVTLTLWTHAVKGLTENDFILAAKIDVL